MGSSVRTYRPLKAIRGLLAIMVVLAAGVFVASARAHGGDVTANIRFHPQPPVAGQPISFDVELWYGDDGEPFEGERFALSAQGPDGASIPEVMLAPTGEVGHWSGQLTLPGEGVWTMLVRVEAETGVAQDRYNVQVRPAGTTPSEDTGNFMLELIFMPEATAGRPFWVNYWPLILGALIVGILVLVFLFMPGSPLEEEAEEARLEGPAVKEIPGD
ncbi:MAG TPA: hypothetical protein VER55_13230 [Ardenticatenaceae bacterium]|nr:hypothetical protein [Ardenticatenaceae bacterium]